MTHPRPFTAAETELLADALNALVESGGSPGGVIVCGAREPATAVVLASGQIAPECGSAVPTDRTRYDIASLTKVTATWPLIGQALDGGVMDLDAPIRDFLPPMTGEAPSGTATVRQLLSHTSGLMAATRLDQYRGATLPLHELILREPLAEEPGTHRYINRGFILLGLALTHTLRQPLDQAARTLWTEAGMDDTQYGPLTRAQDVAPTEQLLPGAPRVWGGVHDDNAMLMGGVAGHAGVFSTPADLAAYARALLTDHAEDTPRGRWLHAGTVPHAPIEPGLHRGLGWILADEGRVAYHHGFTGTSLYLNPTAGRFIVLCTNAIYHGPARHRLAPLRTTILKTLTTT